MNAFYAGTLLTLVPSVMTVKIDSSSISTQASERPSNQIAAGVSYCVVYGQGHVVERRVDVIYSFAPMNVERWSPFLKTRS